MEIRFHVILLIICSVLLAWCWRRRGFSSPSTLMLVLCVVISAAKLISLVWAVHAADLFS
jgi:hypothetical protein